MTGKVTKLDVNRIAPEVAEAEFERFAEMMDMDLDESSMRDDDKQELLKHKRRIIKAICNGSLMINELGEAVYTPRHPRSIHKEPITFHEHSGASIMAIDGKSERARIAATYAIMGDMCCVHPNVFSGLVGPDDKLCKSLFALLMD